MQVQQQHPAPIALFIRFKAQTGSRVFLAAPPLLKSVRASPRAAWGSCTRRCTRCRPMARTRRCCWSRRPAAASCTSPSDCAGDDEAGSCDGAAAPALPTSVLLDAASGSEVVHFTF